MGRLIQNRRNRLIANTNGDAGYERRTGQASDGNGRPIYKPSIGQRKPTAACIHQGISENSADQRIARAHRTATRKYRHPDDVARPVVRYDPLPGGVSGNQNRVSIERRIGKVTVSKINHIIRRRNAIKNGVVQCCR